MYAHAGLTRQRLVIVAEEDATVREVLVRALEREGHRVVPVESGEDLIDQVRRVMFHGECGGHVDLVISDAQGPGLNGAIALMFIRDADIDVPMILIAMNGDRWVSEAPRHGIRLLLKPLDPFRVTEAVRAEIAR
jgi:CheY-like chemotaxis protein